MNRVKGVTIADRPASAAVNAGLGSAVRTLPAPSAAVIATGGFAVVVGTWLTDGATAVAGLNGAGWLAALVIGLRLRLLDHRHRALTDNEGP